MRIDAAPIGRGARRSVVRGAAVLIALLAVLAGVLRDAGPASAAPPAGPVVRLVAGDRMVTATWSRVPDAVSYTVRVAAAGSRTASRTVVTTRRTVRLARLRNGRAYAVSVAVDRPLLLQAAAMRSSTVRAVATPGFPLPVGQVVASPGPAPDQVTVAWTGGGRATKVAVVAGADATADRRSFHSAWYPATTRSITVTVPARYRDTMGAGTGNPVWVKVVQSNSGSTAFGARASVARAYRPAPAGVRSLARATAPDAAVSRLVVGELNTQSEAATAGFSSANRWASRVGRLAEYIDSTSRATTGVGRPDLLLTAELTTRVLGACENHPGRGEPYRCRSRTQLADLAGRLDRLRLADTDAYDRVLDRGRRAPSWAGRVTDGAHVFYDPRRLTLLGHGFYSPAMTPAEGFGDVEGLGVAGWTPATIGPDRWLSWAELRINRSGRRFYAVAVHLPAGDSPALVAARTEVAAKLSAAIERRAGTVPVVLGGDLNGDATRDPRAAQAEFVRHGFFDAAAAPLRTGAAVNTANLSGPQSGDPGYGAAPVQHAYDTSRIDVILLRDSPYAYRYANVLRLRADGSFRKDLQGTDHNMQLAAVGIADPVPATPAPAPTPAPTPTTPAPTPIASAPATVIPAPSPS